MHYNPTTLTGNGSISLLFGLRLYAHPGLSWNISNFADHILKSIFFNIKVWISIKISLMIIPTDQTDE